MQSLPRSTSTDVANLLIGLNSIEVEIDCRKLILFGQLCNVSYHYIIKEVFIHRLVNFESAAATQHGFIHDIYRIFGKYSLLTYLHMFLENGCFNQNCHGKQLFEEGLKNFPNPN